MVDPILHDAQIWMFGHDQTAVSGLVHPAMVVLDVPMPVPVTVMVAPLCEKV